MCDVYGSMCVCVCITKVSVHAGVCYIYGGVCMSVHVYDNVQVCAVYGNVHAYVYM